MKKRNILRRVAAIVLLLCVKASPCAAFTYSNPTGDEFPILAWFSILPDEEQTPERYRELAEAGFNITFPHFSTLSQVRRALTAMEGTGVYLLATCGEIRSDPQTAIGYLRRQPLVCGYFIGDEPNVAGMEAYGQTCAAIRRYDPVKLVYGNLLPNYANMADVGAESYRDYVQKYIEIVNPGLLSFDNYPIRTSGSTVKLRSGFYENLQIVHEEAERMGWPFWGFALATAHGSYPVPTLAHLRLQIFSNLAFGAQGIQYFTYWTPLGTQWDFHNAPIDENGQRTDVYYLIQQVNGVVQNLSWVFLGAKVKQVGFTANVPTGCATLRRLPDELRRLRCEQGLLVSELENGDKRYLVLVNHSVTEAKNVTITARADRMKRILETGEKQDVLIESYKLEPGNMAVYELLDEGAGVSAPDADVCPQVFAARGCIRVVGGKAEVYTLDGRMVGHTVDVLPVPSGFYVVKTRAGSRKLYVR
ncbi:MAG: beta-galactosidase [Bacteroidaceae bacterium]|nr:beta-galactosidase [Bacteroidaceae bacterium]